MCIWYFYHEDYSRWQRNLLPQYIPGFTEPLEPPDSMYPNESVWIVPGTWRE